jgi:hypothetical protein
MAWVRKDLDGRGSTGVQRGGLASEQDARDALERVQRERRISRRLTLAELVAAALSGERGGYLDTHHFRRPPPYHRFRRAGCVLSHAQDGAREDDAPGG